MFVIASFHCMCHTSCLGFKVLCESNFSQAPALNFYFRELAEYVRRMDIQARPVTMAVRSLDLTDY